MDGRGGSEGRGWRWMEGEGVKGTNANDYIGGALVMLRLKQYQDIKTTRQTLRGCYQHLTLLERGK